MRKHPPPLPDSLRTPRGPSSNPPVLRKKKSEKIIFQKLSNLEGISKFVIENSVVAATLCTHTPSLQAPTKEAFTSREFLVRPPARKLEKRWSEGLRASKQGYLAQVLPNLFGFVYFCAKIFLR
jgi:hypothetical protein